MPSPPWLPDVPQTKNRPIGTRQHELWTRIGQQMKCSDLPTVFRIPFPLTLVRLSLVSSALRFMLIPIHLLVILSQWMSMPHVRRLLYPSPATVAANQDTKVRSVTSISTSGP